MPVCPVPGRRIQSMGGQAIQVFYRPGMPAVIGCLWYRIMDMYPIHDGGL
jgi:hypothetical protein